MKMFPHTVATAAVVALCCLACLADPKDKPAPDESRPRKIYGHYMGCFCAGRGAIQYHAMNAAGDVGRPEQKRWPAGEYRNYALAPQGRGLSVTEAADLEIRRAMRIGMDGFTFDAWAGGEDAQKLLDEMFRICEEKDYPFELTITLDSSCLPGGEGNRWANAIKWLLERHGESPKLARRDGKPLIMGYQSAWPWVSYLYARKTGATGDEKQKEVMRLRASEEGWRMIGDAYREIEKEVGQDIYWQFCLSAFFHGLDETGRAELKKIDGDPMVRAAGVIAEQLPAVGMFMWGGKVPEIAQAVQAAGGEWCHPFLLQYQNYGWLQMASPGADWVRGQWAAAREWPSTLVQFITWNDYHESTNLSPGYNTRYAYYDLTGHFIEWWKTGRQPEVDHDKVYIFSHKYAPGSEVTPFEARKDVKNVLEVVTILPSPATVRLPGRDAEWRAPAGMSHRQFPLTPGAVTAELVRDGKVVVRLEHPEPITDRPFRQDIGKTCISTEFARHWTLDFGDIEPFHYSEYGDADGDGLPNWFEMYYFGKFGQMATATDADPDADPDRDGKSNLAEYRERTDPTLPPPPDSPVAPSEDAEHGTVEQLLEDI